ncbi:hypothetical protein JTB14_001674 [Gonioctena quinquepunctata]|nr:hypothetical protein JTB14_001674 [Gonioctena quinquepunctata]
MRTEKQFQLRLLGLVAYLKILGRHNVNVEEQILAAFEADPTISIRVVARDLNLSIWKVWSTMHNEKKYPFHGTGVQGLEETDPARRIRFCRFLLNADIDDAWLLKSILWTDESKFSREGITNFHNLHEWADKDSNPHWKKQRESMNYERDGTARVVYFAFGEVC